MLGKKLVASVLLNKEGSELPMSRRVLLNKVRVGTDDALHEQRHMHKLVNSVFSLFSSTRK